MIKWLARWILRQEINDIEHDCWHDGVNQQRYDPKSAEHGLKSFSMYWYGIEGEGEEEGEGLQILHVRSPSPFLRERSMLSRVI